MQSDLAKRILRHLRRKPMFRAGDHVGVAVSGGADSVALLRLLEEVAGHLGIRLAIIHFNHLLRGAESDADEQFVAGLAAGRNLPFLAGHEDVAGAARLKKWNLEDAGRRLRYAYFASLLRAGTVAQIAVAHTADDQAETVLARLIRGTGPAGMAAIYPTHRIQQDFGCDENVAPAAIVRPLLGIRRSELRAYLVALGQAWREDSSNQDTRRLRARLRHRVLPLMEHELQPALVPHLCRLADMAREDEAFWMALVSDQLKRSTLAESGGIAIRCEELLAPFPFLQGQLASDGRMAVSRRLVRGLFEMVAGDCRQLTAQHVEGVLSLAAPGCSGKSCDLPGVRVNRSFDYLWFHPRSTRVPGSDNDSRRNAVTELYSHCFELGGLGETTAVTVPEIGRRFHLKVVDWPTSRREDTREYAGEGVLDRDLLHTPLILRNWRPGDSFRPQGRRGVHKLKHFLQAGRVAAWDRAKWPVLTSGGQLVWARGLSVAAKFAPRHGTRTGVLITEEEA